MTGYRLIFNISDPRIDSMAAGIVAAPIILADALTGLGEGVEVLSQNYLTSHSGVVQFIVRFAAADDATASAAAEGAIAGVRHLPVDSISLARRARRYVNVA